MRGYLTTKWSEPLLNDIKMKDSLMDAGYDKEEVYKFLEEKGINKPGLILERTL